MGAPKGNKYNQKYSEEEAKEIFLKALEYANSNDDCLCVQDAIFHVDMPCSTFHWLSNNYKELEDIKKNINDAVIRRINRGSLKGNYNVTAGIWRMKQLGEKDRIEQEITQRSQNIIQVVDKETETEINKLMNQ